MQSSQFPVFARSILLLAVVLTGCSSMSKNECLSVDWRTVGYEDGVAGYSADRIAQHRKACAKYGVSTDLSAYQQGRLQGLQEYCKPANGYRLGVRGGSYYGVCPANLEPAFVTAFDSGHQLYVLEARVSNTDRQIDYKRHELEEAQRGVITSSAAAVSSDSSQDRVDAVADAARLAERAGRLRGEIRQLQEDRVRFQTDLDNYRSSQPPIT